MNLLSTAVIAGGSLMLIVSAIGLFSFRDALSRQHAATKAGTFALTLILVGVALHGGSGEWAWRVAVIILWLFATLPVASHMLARVAARHAYSSQDIETAPLIDPRTSSTPSPTRRP